MSDSNDDAVDRPSYGEGFAARIGAEGAKRAKGRDLKPLRAIGPYLARRRVEVGWALFFLVVAAGASLAIPLGFRSVIDVGFGQRTEQALDQSFLALAGVALVLALASAGRFYFVSRIGERVVADLRADVYDHLMALSPGYFARVSIGEVLSRLSVDASLIETVVGSSASVALRSTLTLVGAMALLFITDAKLAGLLLLIIPLMVAPIMLFGRKVRKLSTTAQDRVADSSIAASESVDAIETVQAFGLEDTMRRRYRGSVEAAFEAASRRIGARAVLTAAAIAVMFLGVSFVLWLGARDVLDGRMTVGVLAQFVMFAVLAAGSGASISEVYGDVLKASGAAQRLTEILAERPQIAAPVQPKPLPAPGRGALALQKVNFVYPEAEDRAALRDVSLDVRPGETVALVGPSGAGKSTVFRLLLRFYDPVSGDITLDGVSASEADPREWRRRFAYVSQDAALFTGTARENVRLGREDASDEAVAKALRRAEAWAFLEARGGADGALGDRARALSGGERQRLALARALLRDAPVLLLDEATSALDSQNEKLVQNALAEARKGRTTLVIAHRLATVLQADRIVVLDSGRIVEMGAHADLIARGGLYARLASLQFSAAA